MTDKVGFWARDFSGQKQARFEEPRRIPIGDLTGKLRDRLKLPMKDPQGNGLSYRVRNDSRGTILAESDLVGDAVDQDDRLIMLGEPVAG